MKKKQILTLLCVTLFTGGLFAQNTIEVTNGTGSKKGSLAAALEDAQEGDLIRIANGVNEVVIDKEIVITKSVTVDGNGKTIQVKKPMKSTYRLFTIGQFPKKDAPKCTVVFKNCRFLGGNTSSTESNAPSTSYSACFYVMGTAKFNLEKSIVENSIASYGAGIFNGGGDVTVTDCEFMDNSSNRNGGAIYDQRGKMTIVNSKFLRNDAKAVAGAVGVMEAYLGMKNCTFKENSSTNGGALGTFNKSKIRIENTTFEGSQASRFGGAFFGGSTEKAIFRGCTFASNSSTKFGGALYTEKSTIEVGECAFEKNISEEDGGAVYISGSGRGDFDRCFFDENFTRGLSGGAIANFNILSVINSTFYRNEALGQDNSMAGAIYNGKEAHLFNCTVVGNLARTQSGGIVSEKGGTLEIVNTLLSHNFRDNEAMDLIVKDGAVQGNGNIAMKFDIASGANKMNYTEPTIYSNQKLYKKIVMKMPVAEMNGGKTKTIAVEPDGIAAGVGRSDDRVTEDQRGEKRPSAPTIGAFEANPTK